MMIDSQNKASARSLLHILVTLGGVAALGWEVIWQIRSSLALGVSAKGTALTLAVMMGGMSLGAFVMGRALKEKTVRQPMHIYGVLEMIIGFCGLLLPAAFGAVETMDTWVYAREPEAAPVIHILGIALAQGVAAICMGATLPVMGLAARPFRTSLAALYGLNTLGAAFGALLAAFFLVPCFGLTRAGWALAAADFTVGVLAFLLRPEKSAPAPVAEKAKFTSRLSPTAEEGIVIVTGFATFALEVAWFRSITAAFQSTTPAFAVMVASVLLALGAAAKIVPLLRRRVSLGSVLSWAGILILLATPVIERFDLIVCYHQPDIAVLAQRHALPSAGIEALYYLLLILRWFIVTLYVAGPPMLLLGVAFPWILDAPQTPRRWGKLYALNTLAAIAGSIGAAWLLLPLIGFAATAWLAGAVVAVTGVALAPKARRVTWGSLAAGALVVAVACQSGVGTTRAQGLVQIGYQKPTKLLESYQGPEATVSVVEYANGGSALVVDGFIASGQFGPDKAKFGHYMPWMGHLPMILARDPEQALVICFGTGQTANAVMQENPRHLDIVDINPRIFKLAHNFPANHGVLQNPKATPIVMDGRAYMRRVTKTYDVITLEPMPPTFAGVNALYSQEFYREARAKLNPGGMIAQWVPFHLLSVADAKSIAKTFQSIFPNAILWIDPMSKTGVLVGTTDDNGNLGSSFPGFGRPASGRDLTKAQVMAAVQLTREQLQRYDADASIITDDNQLLAYGRAVESAIIMLPLLHQQGNLDLIEQLRRP